MQGVPERVWKFSVGGYQVCDKWLKDRKGRSLSAHEFETYNRIVWSINESLALSEDVDMVIDSGGGWTILFQ